MEIFAQAVDLPLESRSSLLDDACGSDKELRANVEALLDADLADSDFIDGPIVELLSVSEDLERGQRVGSYEIVREIGQGGMSSVYLATRVDGFEKTVAIKILRRGLDTAYSVRRFRNERQILANLEHPYIARLLDGGATEDGRPYVVMEYVEGVPIDSYCETHGLSIRSRLELFMQVCSAVAVAHRNLVVHRDIKPSNILITPDGVPKLLDFGISKLLGTESPDPAWADRFMTAEYASPEQVRGAPVGIATDVYSLGVLLYLILAGELPYAFKDRHELQWAICELDVSRPSLAVKEDRQLSRMLHGDLDAIVLKSLLKEPDRRYGSVEQLSNDIRRHLLSEPVMARAPTFSYRASRFFRRHRFAITAGLLVMAMMLSFLVSVFRQSRVLALERDRFKVLSEVMVELHGQNSPATKRQVLEEGVKDIKQEFDEESTIRAGLLSILARVYLASGDFKRAEELLLEVLDVQRRLLGDHHPDTRTTLRSLLEVYSALDDKLAVAHYETMMATQPEPR